MIRHVRNFAVALAILLIAAELSACSAEQPVSPSAIKLDTVVTITLYGGEDGELIDEAFSEIDRLAALLDVNDEGSELYLLAENAGRDWTNVSDETMEVLKLSKYYYELSDGYFDVTAAPIVELWDVLNGGYYPSEAERKAAAELTNGSELLLEGNRAMLAREGMKADLGGIAKGYIADKVKALLTERGVEHAIIDLGGNILLIGGKSEEQPFTIGVQDPNGESGEVLMKVSVSDKSLVSSGIYERYFEYDGKKYHHIMDPFTASPSESDLAGVTIISEHSVDGDALSTACLLLGSEKGMELVESLDGVEAVFVRRDEAVIISSGMDEYVNE